MTCEWCGSFSFDLENWCDKCKDEKSISEKGNTLEYIELGSTPYDEDCAQVGRDDYRERARLECRVYAEQLKRIWPDGDFRVKSAAHDFGTYYYVAAYYDPNDEHQTNIAYEAEATGPANWDAESLAKLNTKVSQ